MTVAVIGAGMAGISCARELAAVGEKVVVFDKARGPSGRMSTRRAKELQFDHGAQFFTARGPAFRSLCDQLIADEVVAEWNPKVVRLGDDRPPRARGRLVGIPTMSRVVRHLSAGLEVRTERRIAELHPNGDGVELVDVDGTPAGTFAAVAVAIPAPQAAGLLAPALPELATALERVRMAPCWAAMVELAEPAGVDFDAAEIADGALRWLSNDGSKPGRSGRTWVAHASPEFSRQHLEASPEQVGDRLADEVRRWLNRAAIADLRVHRWRYALCEQPLGRSHIFEPASGVGIAGDWCIGGRIEAAYDSGRALGEALANRR